MINKTVDISPLFVIQLFVSLISCFSCACMYCWVVSTITNYHILEVVQMIYVQIS